MIDFSVNNQFQVDEWKLVVFDSRDLFIFSDVNLEYLSQWFVKFKVDDILFDWLFWWKLLHVSMIDWTFVIVNMSKRIIFIEVTVTGVTSLFSKRGEEFEILCNR